MVPASESGVTQRQEFGGTEVTRQAETAMSAMAAQHKAMVEARFIVAMRQGRNWLNVRSEMNELCVDPGFASEALYVKPLSRTPDKWNEMDKRQRLQLRLEGKTGDWPVAALKRLLRRMANRTGLTKRVIIDDAIRSKAGLLPRSRRCVEMVRSIRSASGSMARRSRSRRAASSSARLSSRMARGSVAVR